MPLRTLAELVDPEARGMRAIEDWIARSDREVEILPCRREDGQSTLLALQVTTRTPLGAVARYTGGLLVDHGWLRVLGAGSPRLPRSLASWNRLGADEAATRLPGALLVADDAVGGFYAVDGGRLPGRVGNVHYFAPDVLAWEDLGLDYDAWLRTTLLRPLERFYGELRYAGWHEEMARVGGDEAVAIEPHPWDDGPELARRTRRSVPVEELFDRYVGEVPKKLGLGHLDGHTPTTDVGASR